MTPPHKEVGHTVIVAFWRTTDDGVEFFVPTQDYPMSMSLAVNGNAAETARRVTTERFSLNPRSNARTFEIAGQRVVAFTLTASEEAQISPRGDWLLPRQIKVEVLSAMLQDVATRL